jgi:hypothetical protein
MLRRFHAGAASVMFAAALAGCNHSAPKGQIAATVNGQDITDAEVQAEMTAGNAKVDRKTALQRVITRALVTQYGRENSIDKDPKLLIEQRRMSENLLAARTLQSIASKVRQPLENEANDYLAAHSEIYPDRRQLLVDELVLPEAALKGKPPLPAVQTVEALAVVLNERKIPFQRRQGVIDTATSNPLTAKALFGKPVGSVTSLSQSGLMGYLQVLKERPAPISKEDAVALVRTKLARESAQNAIKTLEDRLRKDAKIQMR